MEKTKNSLVVHVSVFRDGSKDDSSGTYAIEIPLPDFYDSPWGLKHLYEKIGDNVDGLMAAARQRGVAA